MKKKIYVLFLSVLLLVPVKAQNNIDIALSETDLNELLQVIKSARAVNFGDIENRLGLNYWYINLNNATVDIQPNNKIIIDNIEFSGGVDIDLWAFNLTPTATVRAKIECVFEVNKNSQSGGYYLTIVPRIPQFNYNGPLQKVVNLVALLTGNFKWLIPKIEVNLGKSLLPNLLSKYVKSDVPQIKTTDNEVIVSYEMVLDEINVTNRVIKSGENISYAASRSIKLGAGTEIKNGAIFRAQIVNKNMQQFFIKSNDDKKQIYNEGDTIISHVMFEVVEAEDSVDSEIERIEAASIENTEIKETANLLDFVIYDVRGSVVYQSKDVWDLVDLDTSFLSPGIYLIKYTTDKGIKTKKIIVQ